MEYYRWWKIPGFIPTDLSKTIVYVLNFFILTKWKLINKWPLPWYDHSLYTGQRRYILLLYYSEFLELGTGTCKTSASSMLREGDWSHIQDTTPYVEVFSLLSTSILFYSLFPFKLILTFRFTIYAISYLLL